MCRRTLTGVTIISILEISGGLLFIVFISRQFYVLSNKFMTIILIMLFIGILLLTMGLLTLRLKPLGRWLNEKMFSIILILYLSDYLVSGLQGFRQHKILDSFYIFSSLSIIMISAFFGYFFTLPKVKEQFKPKAKDGKLQDK